MASSIHLIFYTTFRKLVLFFFFFFHFSFCAELFIIMFQVFVYFYNLGKANILEGLLSSCRQFQFKLIETT